MTSQLPGPASPMSTDAEAVREREGLEVEARSLWRLFRQRFFRHKLAMTSLVLFAIIMLAAMFAEQVAPRDPFQQSLLDRQTPPGAEFWFGTDQLGRDYFSRVLYGTRTSVSVALVVALLSTAIGTVIGLLSGYFRGWLDNVFMRLVDFIIAVPFLAVVLVVMAFLGRGSPFRVGMILSLLLWTTIARVVRGNVLSLREKEFVEAAKASGAGDLRIMFRHILPNTLSPIIVNATLVIALAILLESALSFLGFGIQRPFPALGAMINDGQRYMLTDWWLVVMPGVAIVVVCLCVNFIGDGLRDALDPTQQRK